MKLITAFLAFLMPIFPQALPDAKNLLSQSGEALNKVRSYQYESQMVMDMTVAGNPVNVSLTNSVAAVNPNKKRVESKSQVGGAMLISDGEYTWFYSSALHQYVKKAALQTPQSILTALGLGDLPDPGQVFKDLKTIGDEPIEIGGKKFDCWRLESRIDRFSMPQVQGVELTDGVARFWIAKELKITLQMTMSGNLQGGPMPGQVAMQQKMTMLSLKIDVDLPDSLFHFTPPEGAKEVADFAAPGLGKPDLAGKPGLEFRVQSLDGKAYDLAELKGKVVLLDFWATWCGPCRKEMPDLDKLQDEYRDSGLVLLGLDVGEDRETVENYVKKSSVSHAIALTNGTSMVSAYRISALPTYILIGRDGTVIDTQVGSAGPEALRSLLAKAGLKPGDGKDR